MIGRAVTGSTAVKVSGTTCGLRNLPATTRTVVRLRRGMHSDREPFEAMPRAIQAGGTNLRIGRARFLKAETNTRTGVRRRGPRSSASTSALAIRKPTTFDRLRRPRTRAIEGPTRSDRETMRSTFIEAHRDPSTSHRGTSVPTSRRAMQLLQLPLRTTAPLLVAAASFAAATRPTGRGPADQTKADALLEVHAVNV